MSAAPEAECRVSWASHGEHLVRLVGGLVTAREHADVTLVAGDGARVRAHKVVLAGCSPVLASFLASSRGGRDQPLIFLRGVDRRELEAVLQFLYLGEAAVPSTRMEEFLSVARDLKIHGISDDTNVVEEKKTSENPRQTLVPSINKTTSLPNNNDTRSRKRAIIKSEDHPLQHFEEDIDLSIKEEVSSPAPVPAEFLDGYEAGDQSYYEESYEGGSHQPGLDPDYWHLAQAGAQLTEWGKRKPKVHECRHCGKQFTRTSKLKDHESIHTGVLRHKCPYCGKLFMNHGTMWAHKKQCGFNTVKNTTASPALAQQQQLR